MPILQRRTQGRPAGEPAILSPKGSRLGLENWKRAVGWRIRIAELGRPTMRVHDLRHTFAVHCLNAWLREGKDAREMLPILSAYMGHVMLRSTEQYLRLVPDRFKKQLARLAADPTDVGYGSRRNCADSLSATNNVARKCSR